MAAAKAMVRIKINTLDACNDAHTMSSAGDVPAVVQRHSTNRGGRGQAPTPVAPDNSPVSKWEIRIAVCRHHHPTTLGFPFPCGSPMMVSLRARFLMTGVRPRRFDAVPE